jgi:two-component system response regulator DesR
LSSRAAARLSAWSPRSCNPTAIRHAPRARRPARVAADGASTEDIAATLFLSPATVRNYLSNAMSKLGARNRIEAIRIAREAAWL